MFLIPCFFRNKNRRETAAFLAAGAQIEWKETPGAHVFKADVPGLKKEELKVEVEDGNVLMITGERKKELVVEKNGTCLQWHLFDRSSGKFITEFRHRSSGKFIREFRLPENAKLDQLKVKIENGVLTVTVPKEEVKKPEVESVDISG